MYREIEQCIGELRVNHTDKDIAGALSEYFQIVKSVSYGYTSIATVADLRADHPELNFMDDEEIEGILEQAEVMRQKREERKKPDYREFMERCIKAHMEAFEDWPYGAVERFFEDGDGNFCLRYQGGMYWHYKEEDGGIVWW